MSNNFLVVVMVLGASSSIATNPVGKVVSMLSGLQSELIKEASEAQKMYTEFAEMCEERSRELHNELKTGKATAAELGAAIEKAVADEAVLEEKIGDAADSSSDAESELKKATQLRAKESADFKTEEAELQRTINTIERAITLLERQGSGASLAQLKQAQSITQVLETMAEAEAINSDDASRLTALVQQSSGESSDEEDDEMGAPSAAAYEGKSGQIIDTLEGLLEKTQKQLEDARNGEKNAQHAYSMMKMSLEAKIKTDTKEMAESKKAKAMSSETQATATGNLDVTKKDHAETAKELAELHRECLDKATAYEEGMTVRNEELKALAEAKKILVSTTGGATEQTYLAQTSFLQVAARSKAKAKAKAKSESSAADVLHMVRRIAFSDHSNVLIELANHIESAIQSSGFRGTDPFGKVKGMVQGMIERLEKQADSEATKKAYCDKELAESGNSKEDKESTIESLSTQIDVMASQSKTLKAEVARLQKELGALSRTQAEMDKLRMEEKAVYAKNKPVMEQGLDGIKKALKVLRDYYAADEDGAASGIIGMLEVIESDFSKGIAEMVSSEESSAAEYQSATNENQVAKATKEQDRKLKTGEFVAIDKSIAEFQSDRTGSKSELSAVMEYLSSLKKDCIAAPSSYEERKARRDKEIAGLKQALDTLGGDAALLQKSTAHRTLRGGKLEASD
jgi:hypothetical protein